MLNQHRGLVVWWNARRGRIALARWSPLLWKCPTESTVRFRLFSITWRQDEWIRHFQVFESKWVIIRLFAKLFILDVLTEMFTREISMMANLTDRVHSKEVIFSFRPPMFTRVDGKLARRPGMASWTISLLVRWNAVSYQNLIHLNLSFAGEKYGTSYEGKVAGVGILGGKVLHQFPNGDIIQGTFHGFWFDGFKSNATLTKASLSTQLPMVFPVCQSVIYLKQQNGSGVPAEQKWRDIFRPECCAIVGLFPVTTQWTAEDSTRAWDQNRAVLNKSKLRAFNDHLVRPKSPLQHHRQGSSVSVKSIKSERLLCAPQGAIEISEILQLIPDYGRNQLNADEFFKIETYLHEVIYYSLLVVCQLNVFITSQALESDIHPLGRLAAQVGDVYRATCVGVEAHPRLLPHAVAEVHSFVSCAFIRLLFPALPEERAAHLIPSGKSVAYFFTFISITTFIVRLFFFIEPSDNGQQKLQAVVSANTLLLSVLVPRLYPNLYTFYVLHNQKMDDLYWERLQKWKSTDGLGANECLDWRRYQVFHGRYFAGRKSGNRLSPATKHSIFSWWQAKSYSSNIPRSYSRTVQSPLGADYVMNMDDLFPGVSLRCCPFFAFKILSTSSLLKLLTILTTFF